MPVRRDSRGVWRYRKVVKFPDGTKERIFGTPPRNTKQAAERAEREHIDRALAEWDARQRNPEPEAPAEREEVPTFKSWFEGRFMREWVVGRKNKPSEVQSKSSIFRVHLDGAFGPMRLNEIDVGVVARFRAELIESGLSDKRINNILAVLSKALRYAQDVQLIDRAPRVGLLKIERPEIECWDFEQYGRILLAAKHEGEPWYVASLLAGDAGLRIGEIRALRWREDVDLVAGTVTINQQMRNGILGTPKGRTRRAVPMTDRLRAALKALPVVRTGNVVRNPDGTVIRDGQASHAARRICRKAGLPESGWHRLRHSFGTHAAMFGANPWRLMTWMGHKRIDETMLYVHFAENHMRPLPDEIVAAGNVIADPDRRVIAMLGTRGNAIRRGNHVATPQGSLAEPLGRRVLT